MTYSEIDINSIIEQTAKRVAEQTTQQLVCSLNLDNYMTQEDELCQKGKDDMAKKIKRRLTINGKEQWVCGNNEQEIFDAAAKKMIAEKAAPAQTTICFQPYAETWKHLYRDGKRKHTTISEYQSILEHHLYPAFGDKHIDEISTNSIQAFLNEAVKPSGKPYAKKTLNEVLMVLAMILDSAVEDGIIQKNPARSKRLVNPSKIKRCRTPLSEEQIADVATHIEDLKNEDDRLFVALLLYTGMRRNEILGLRWGDVDLSSQTLHVRRGVTFKANAPVIDVPKTDAGIRDVPVLPQLIKYMNPKDADVYLIGGTNTPVTQCYIKRMWERIARTINVYDKTPHSFRHTFATQMWRAGIDENVMLKIGGWADKRTMQSVYTHVQQSDVDKARQEISEAFAMPM